MLFQIYGDTALWQLLGWALVFTGLVLANEIARRSKAGGIFFFLVLPVVGGSPAKMCGCSAAGGISSTAWPVSSTFCV